MFSVVGCRLFASMQERWQLPHPMHRLMSISMDGTFAGSTPEAAPTGLAATLLATAAPPRAGGGPARPNVYQALADQGIKIQGFLRGQGDPARVATMAKTPGVIGMHHYGVATDNWFKQGQLDVVRDYVKRIRDTGLLVGVAAHMPEAIAEVESQGWDIDYYMTCVYQRHRSEEELKALLGHVPIPIGEVYLKSDPPRMFKAMRQTKRP